jgi:hypothetical protein
MKSLNKIEIDKIYTNKRTGQQYLLIPKKKLKGAGIEGKKLTVSW